MKEQLTELDKQMIDSYRRYHTRNEWRGDEKYVEVDELLEPYYENKQRLFKMFGNQFILEKDIDFERGADELSKVICKELYDDNGKLRKFRDYFIKRVNEIWRATMGNAMGYEDDNEPFLTFYYEMMREDNFIQNKITRLYSDESNIAFKSPKDGSKITITVGMKFMKALAKIVEAYDLDKEMFEEFRIAHSQILNDKKLSGRLCLSIHPLDYMTMSDNESDWGSCMSWREGGCYRRGTVEMMTSPIVVVAYLKSDRDMSLFGRYADLSLQQKGWTWNNKKWRELFVVHEGEIIGIKGYPYTSRPLEKAVITWLRELSRENLNYDYTEEIFTRKYNESVVINGIENRYNYTSKAMYNDFGLASNGEHQSVFHPVEEFITDPKKRNICYSGPAVCMCCGEVVEQTAEAYLLCDCCGLEMMTCDCCGWTGSADDFHYIDGCPVCQACYEDETYYDVISGDDHWLDNSVNVSISLVPDRLVQCVDELSEEERVIWDNVHREIWKDCGWDYTISDFSDLDMLTRPNSWTRYSTRWSYFIKRESPQWESGYGYWLSVNDFVHPIAMLDEAYHIYDRNATQLVKFAERLNEFKQA